MIPALALELLAGLVIVCGVGVVFTGVLWLTLEIVGKVVKLLGYWRAFFDWYADRCRNRVHVRRERAALERLRSQLETLAKQLGRPDEVCLARTIENLADDARRGLGERL